MKNFAAGALVCLGLSAVIFPAAAAPAPNWAGFYIGGNLGYGWGNSDSTVDYPSISQGPFGTAPPFSASNTLNLNGVLGGIQFGQNVQVGNWLYGLESDFQFTGQNANSSRTDRLFRGSFIIFGDTLDATTQTETKIQWFGTVRGRAGLICDGLLFYGTGGLAYGRVHLSQTVSILDEGTVLGFPLFSDLDSGVLNRSQTKLGWTVGAGIEAALMPNWSWKAEYLHLDFGKLHDSTLVTDGGTAISIRGSKVTDDLVRFGVNYRFGS
jgi:outer membrane immunogenic protein